MAEKSGGKPEVYNDRRKRILQDLINYEIPNSTDEEKEYYSAISIYFYWMYGISLKEMFYYKFLQLNHTERANYVSFRGSNLYFQRLNDVDYGFSELDDKYKCYQRFINDYKRDVIVIEKEDDFSVFLDFVKKHNEFVVKPSTLSFGWGIHKQKASVDNAYDVFTSILNENEKIQSKYHIKTRTTKFVLEELIDQHDSLAVLHPASINCVRLTTIVVDGRVHFFYPWLKIGCGGNFISNAGDGGLAAGIDLENGMVVTDAFDERGQRYEKHPTTGMVFKGFRIPQWDELLCLGERLALNLEPKINYVGWDMAYTKAGWSILEANPDGEFLAQFAFEKGLKEELEELIDWKPEHEYWWQEQLKYGADSLRK